MAIMLKSLNIQKIFNGVLELPESIKAFCDTEKQEDLPKTILPITDPS